MDTVTDDFDFAIVGLHGHFAESQPQTGGVDSAIRFFFELQEFVENSLMVLGRDSGTVVLDEELDIP